MILFIYKKYIMPSGMLLRVKEMMRTKRYHSTLQGKLVSIRVRLGQRYGRSRLT